MTTICAWCKALMAGPPPAPDEQVSHGCCQKCSERITAGLEGGQGRDADEVVRDYWGCVVVAAAALTTAAILIFIAFYARAHAHG